MSRGARSNQMVGITRPPAPVRCTRVAFTKDGAIALTELEAFNTFRRGGDQRWLELPMPVIPKTYEIVRIFAAT